ASLPLARLVLAAHRCLDVDEACGAVLAELAEALPRLRAAAIYLSTPECGRLAARSCAGGWQHCPVLAVEGEAAAAAAYRDDTVVWTAAPNDSTRGFAPIGAGASAGGVLALELEGDPAPDEREFVVAAAAAVAPALANALAYQKMLESR